MRNLYLLLAIFALIACAPVAQARVILTIDNFLQTQTPVILSVPEATGTSGYWWNPYAYQEGRPPYASFRNTESALGGQRDIVVGFEGFAPELTVGIASVVSRRGTIAFSLDYVGGAYYQYDGLDYTGAEGTFTGPEVIPGALFNVLPGIGAHVNTTAFPERNADGQTVDFTSGGNAVGININVRSDHDVYYYLDVLNPNGVNNSMEFVPTDSEATDGEQFFFRFDDARWESLNGQPFDWTRVAGIQVRIWSFSDIENPGAQSSQAIDTAFYNFFLIGYQIAGVVQIDCQCDGTPESIAPGVEVTIALDTAPGAILGTATTGANGRFVFTGSFLDADNTYQVCLTDGSQPRCSNTPQCQTRRIIGTTDPADLVFSITNPSTIFAPADVTVNCGDCTTTACLGNATRTDCSGNQFPVTTFTDRLTGNCPTQTITRTFTTGGLTATQTITVNDFVAPVITRQASSVNMQCPGESGNPTFQNWLATQGGASATDCNTVSWRNDYNGDGQISCGGVTVTFIATDACGNTSPASQTTASYTIQDTTSPEFTTAAQDASANCNQNGSDFTAFNTWLNNHGNSVASDNCGGVTYTNNYQDDTLTRGCSNSAPVTFTAHDICGNVASSTATFTIRDNTPPSITTPASNRAAECSSTDQTPFNTWLNAHAFAVANDVCQGSDNLVWSNDFVGSPPVGCSASSGPVTFSVTDGCGTVASTTATFTVSDTQSPVLVTPASALNVDCSSSTGADQLNQWLNNNGGAVATDSCTGVTWSNDFDSSVSGSCASRPITFTATDSCGRAVRTTATYSINDNQPPTISGVTSPTVDCDSDTNTAFNTWLSSNGGASAVDNCASSNQITIRSNYTSANPPNRGCLVVTRVAFTASDPCGNTSPASVGTFTIQDLTNPTITVAAQDANAPCGSSATTAYNTFVSTRGGAQATDTCSAVSWANDAPATPAFDGCSGFTVVTFTARDSCGLTAATTATFAISDNTPPNLTRAAQSLTEECTSGNETPGLNNWLSTNGGATATDACSSVTWVNNFVTLSGGCNSSAPVTFTASDQCGQSVSTTATYTIRDSRPPVISTPAQSISVPCDADTHSRLLAWVNSNGNAVASDACSGGSSGLTWTRSLYDNVVGCSFATVTFTVTDPCGLSASTTATFTSVDSAAPSFNPAAQDLTVQCDGQGNVGDYDAWVASHGGASAVDECAFSFTWTSNAPATGPTTCGFRTVTFTVTDNCNNAARTTATFTVSDSQKPQFNSLPQDLVVECGSSANAQLNEWLTNVGGATASDVCASTVSYSNTAGSVTGDNCNSIRPYTFRAADQCGNVEVATANYVVRDTTAPTISRPVDDATFECDGNGNIAQINQWIQTRGGATATDSCSSNITWVHDYPGSGPLTCTSFQVTFTAMDPCGNAVSDSATLAITDNTDPVFSFFPQDYTVPCDADTSVEVLGTATATDVCSGSLFVSMSETSFDEPAVGNCPGDHVITRTFSAVDDCGNSISREQVITVQIVRSSGPCDPEGCECDSCCPPPVASDCLPVDCEAAPCQRTPCTASACSCGNQQNSRDVIDFQPADDLIEPLPQCKPVYIYVNDDDDSEKEVDATGLVKQRMLVTNQPLHESVLKNKSDASSLSLSFFADRKSVV